MDVDVLIKAVKNRPVLWDQRNKLYHNRDEVKQAWDEVAEISQIDVADCKMKWTNLRNSYSRYVREINRPTWFRGIPKKQWHLAPAMAFMKKQVGHRGKIQEDLVDTEREEDAPDVNVVSPIVKTEDETSSTRSSPLPLDQNLKRKTHPSPEEMVATVPVIDSVKSLAVPQSHGTDESPTLLFFKSMIPDVESLIPKKQRVFKQKVMQLLNTLLDEQEDECGGNASHMSVPTISVRRDHEEVQGYILPNSI